MIVGVHRCARLGRAVIKNKGHVWLHMPFWNGRGCLGQRSLGLDDRVMSFVPLLENSAGGYDDAIALPGAFLEEVLAGDSNVGQVKSQ